jgi:hypothetical protein
LYRYIRTEFRNLPLREILHSEIKVLLGVTASASAALKAVDIITVFDLATSNIFDSASKLVNAGTNFKSALYQYGRPTTDMVREAETAGKTISELQFLPISILEPIPQTAVASIESALDVKTVRDLALYPPYRAAVDLVNSLYFPENQEQFDPERPADLLPKTGEYPTERVQYTTLLMDEIKMGPNDTLVNIEDVNNFKPIDLTKLSQFDAGFKRIAFGALLTFNQSWYTQGVTLGQLLHSTSLAPGESTRVAVVDWSRKSRAGQTEVTNEIDDLSNDMEQNRSISEVTHAVANEAQGGFSSSDTNSTSTQKGTSTAGEISGGLIGSLFGGPSFSMGTTSSEATSASHAESYSNSWGNREIGSDMMQRINDRTHQHAHSSRSRRASVVKEVSQSEHEEVSTRVITNYNHMHALTIQYYEVVQLYRVELKLAKADRVVFIPVQLVDFNNDDTIRRFQRVLATNALSFAMRDALFNLDVIEITPDENTPFTILGGGNLKGFLSEASKTRLDLTRSTTALRNLGGAGLASPGASPSIASAPAAATASPQPAAATAAGAGATTAAATTAAASASLAAAASPAITKLQLDKAVPVMQQVSHGLWATDQIARISGLLNRLVLRPSSSAIYLPTDVSIEGGAVSASGAALGIVFHTIQGGTITSINNDSPLPLTDITRIGLLGSSSERDVSATITLTLNRNGVRFPLELPAVTVAKGTAGETRVVQVKAGGINANIRQHLNDNKMHYSQAIFRSLDTTQIAMLLSGYGVDVGGGKMVPVSQVIEPKPIRYIGNYLAFKMSSGLLDDERWSAWLKDHNIIIGNTKEEIVPLGSGGVFAEAVLGRSNAAEKLDITRFWNWQDSPIPLQPTEIAAIQTGSRATNEDVKPGNLSTPIINITSPSHLPDPVGTSAILSAIQNGNMFRDMSGLQATIGLAQAALQATAAGATSAGQQAGTNMQNHLQAQTERMRIAADLAKSVIGAMTGTGILSGIGGGGSSGGGGNHSQDGAKINYFDKTKKPSSSGAGSPGSSGSSGIGGSGGSSGSGGGGGSGGSGGIPATTFANADGDGMNYSENPAALAATWGDSKPRASLVEKVLNKLPDENAADGGGGDGSFLSDGGSSSSSSSTSPPVSTFTSASVTSPLVANAKLQTALDNAIAACETNNSMSAGTLPLAFTFVEITSGGSALPAAGYKQDEVDYIASEAKVAVMYSAYVLRDMARRFAQATGATKINDLLSQLATQMNPTILSSVPNIASATNITNTHRLPNYKAVLTGAPSGGGSSLDVDFTSAFDTALENMIVPSDNTAAAFCVHGIGYSYLNGALADAGFLDTTNYQGLWVAGDFQMGTVWPYVRINSANDGLVAQAGTTRTMASLVSLIATKKILSPTDCNEMLARLHNSISVDPPWASRPAILKPGCITHNKLGLGPLKSGKQVRSEVSIIDSPVASGRKYVVAWQNLQGLSPLNFDDVAQLILDTITEYEKP